MTPLQPPDRQHLDAAQGWLDLGNHIEASEELEQIGPENRSHPDVLQVRWRVYAKAGRWDATLEIATALTRMTPDRRFGWLHRAFSLRRLDRTAEAKDVLVSVLDKFEANATFPCCLACYCARLGQITEAKGWLTLALANAKTDQERERIKLRAQKEPDLEPIRATLKDL